MNKSSILFILDHPLALRSYNESGVLEKMDDLFSVSIIYLTSRRLVPPHETNSQYRVVQLGRLQAGFLSIYNHTYWWKMAHKALSIENRTLLNPDYSLATRFMLQITRRLSGVRKETLIKLINVFLAPAMREIYATCVENKVNVVIYVTAGGTSTISDSLVTQSKRSKIPVGVIVENWDNISSKAVFNYSPKALGVWGAQSSKFARQIHSISTNSIFEIGNPRIDWLVKNCENNWVRDSIFFAGGSVSFEQELPYIRAACKFAEGRMLRFSYLPHPKLYAKAYQAVEKGLINARNLIGVSKEANDQGMSFPKLSEYYSEFSRAKIFLSSFSTMNLEAAILGIPSIGIDLDTNIYLNGRLQRITERHDHLKEFKDSMSVSAVVSIDEMIKQIEINLERFADKENMRETIESAKYFVSGHEDFVSKMQDFVKRTMQQ